MADYKSTLNLPNTAFSMKANLAQREPERLKAWEDARIYETIRMARQGKPQYILHDGPPYANGDIHIGHCTNKIIKDFILKSKTLSGFDCPYVPGWDCHGLPIEINVEKKVGRAGEKLSHKEFREACRDYAKKQVERQRVDFKRLGVFAEWDNPYLTIDPVFEGNIIRSLAKMIENGHLHQGYKPVHWCSDCKSALAEAEVEYQDKKSPSIDVAFPFTDLAALKSKVPALDAHNFTKVSLVIWTTTPWTLPSNEAVSLHPELEYAFVAIKNGAECIVVASDLVDACMKRYGMEDFQVIASVKGAVLEHQAVLHPWVEKNVPVILGEHVTVESGTGCVHTAPGHGEDDFLVGQKYHLPVDHKVDAKGCFVGDTAVVAGMHITKANPVIMETLKAQNRLMATTEIEHSYPHCWRHKTPIIFRATPQWFISMDQAGLRAQAVKEIDQVKWMPSWGQARIRGMVEGRPDWCISRQRTWTMPITSYIHKDTGDLHPNTQAIMAKVADAVEAKGMEAWYDFDDAELIGKDVDDYHKISDGLDVWFDSGVTHACVLAVRENLRVPADLYLEGSDQHRGWFQSSLLTSVAMNGHAPYKNVVTHGFVVDANGHKMSKSLGNVIAPQQVLSRLGADILRLWVASTDYRNEMAVSDEILNRMSDAYRRIRNTARFLLANLNGFDPRKDLLDAKDMVALDRHMVLRVKQLQDEVKQHYDDFQFHLIYQKLQNFCTVDLGSFYLDIIKDRQYTAKAGSQAHRSAQTAMYHIIETLVRIMAPILSFTAEEIWEQIPGERDVTVFVAEWYDAFPAHLSEATFDHAFWTTMMQVRDEVNKGLEGLRNQQAIKSALDARVTLFAAGPLLDQLKALGDELRFLLITSQAEVRDASEKSGASQATAMKDLFVTVEVAEETKCARCWQRRDDVGQHDAHPELCLRCVENVDGEGEHRDYA